jgi:hypothetical protein
MPTRLALVFLLAVAAGPLAAQGNFDVKDEHIAGMTLNHYFTADNKHHTADFSWAFTKDGFTVKKAKAAIPAHVTDQLLGAGVTADEITGKWKLADGKLELTGIKAGDKAGKEKVSLTVFRTAPTVVRVNAPSQLVFVTGK